MSQITKTTQVKPVPSQETYGRAITVALAITAAMIVAAFLDAPVNGSAVRWRGRPDRLTDGYLPGAIAAHGWHSFATPRP